MFERTRIIEGLYIGTRPDKIPDDINAVLNVSSLPNIVDIYSAADPGRIQAIYWLPIFDLPERAPTVAIIKHAVLVIENWRTMDWNVLVHCAAGISRSPSIVAAYLMKTQHLTKREAFDIILKYRDVHPNAGLQAVLDMYQDNLACSDPTRKHSSCH